MARGAAAPPVDLLLHVELIQVLHRSVVQTFHLGHRLVRHIPDTGHWRAPVRTYDEEGITAHDWIKLRYTGDGMGIAALTHATRTLFIWCSRSAIRRDST